MLDVIAELDRPAVPGLRWTGRDHWHVTVRFLGAIEDPGAVVDALRGVHAAGPVAGVRPVVATLGAAVGRFGNRVLQVPVSGLDELAGRVVEATAGLGQPPPERELSRHLTVARVATGSTVDLRGLAGQALAGRAESRRWTVGELCLVESRLAPAGARYEVLERFPPSSPESPDSPDSRDSPA